MTIADLDMWRRPYAGRAAGKGDDRGHDLRGAVCGAQMVAGPEA
jgi:hypothetical protein